MTNTVLVYGYHGTSRQAAASILDNGFQISRNEYDWLGAGIYFWQDAPERAWQWAIQCHQSEAAVICSLLALDLDNCIDLLDVAWHTVLRNAYNTVEEQYEQMNRPLPRQTLGAHRLDRAVIDFTVEEILERQGRSIDAVRGVFVEGKPIFSQSAIFELAHVQIAVLNSEVIRGSWLEKR